MHILQTFINSPNIFTASRLETSTMLTWSLELFDRLRDTMQTLSKELHDDDVDANNLRKMLNEVSYLKDDFKMSLDNPKQSASDRDTIQKGE